MTFRRHHLAPTDLQQPALSAVIDRCVQLLQERAGSEMAVALKSKDQLGPVNTNCAR